MRGKRDGVPSGRRAAFFQEDDTREDSIGPDDEAARTIAAWRDLLARGELVDFDAEIAARPAIARRLTAALATLRRLDPAFAARPATAASPLVGATLGPYRIERRLGAGGMGEVFLATLSRDTAGLRAGDRVALKLVHAHLLERPGFAERFEREARLGSSIRHDNVVRTFHAASIDAAGATHHVLAMEYVEGETLRAMLEDLDRLPEDLCRHVGREVAKGLAAIHAAGAVHRDLKPENVIVTRDHVVKVMDLGVARLAAEAARLSGTGVFAGSIHYAAPEQFRSGGKDVDARADLFALGIVLYELATGAHPHPGDDLPAVMRKLLEESPRKPAELNPQISPFFEEAISTLLAKDPASRFQSADEVARVLAEGEESAWWAERSKAIRATTRRPLRRIRIPRETALYGRDEEIARLRAVFEKAKAGDGQALLIEGEAGIGKSRLVDEFVGALAQSGEDVNFLFGSYPPGGAATASGAFSVAYREHLGDDEASIRAALPQTPLLVPAFAALLRGDVAPAGAEPLTKDSLQTVFVHATRAFAAQRPTIVLIDDLHFAPEEGRSLFASLALAVPGHRILLVGCARPGLDEKWVAQLVARPQTTRLSLPRLGPKELVHLLRDALRSERLAEELGVLIAVKSDGNPFFVFELLRGLREGQFLRQRQDGTWETTQVIRDIQVPSSIADLVQARVADLADEDRHLLDVAACCGFEFDPLVVGQSLGRDRVSTLQALGRIEQRHRLVRSAGRRFVFDHHQVQEALYAGISELLREEYHALLGEAIEARSGAASREPKHVDGAVCVEIAEHFLKGAKGERALRYLDIAMTYLERNYLNDAAVRLADRALAVSLLVTGASRCDLLLRKAGRLHQLDRSDAQRVTVDEALELARRAGDRRSEVSATRVLGLAYFKLGRLAEAQAHYEQSLAVAQEIGDRQGEAMATGNLGLVFHYLDDFTKAQAHLERDVVLEQELGSLSGEAKATSNLGDLYHSRGRFAEAQAQFERSLVVAREIGDRRIEAIALVNLGILWVDLGVASRGRDALAESLAICREIGVRYPEGYAIQGLGAVAEMQGDTAAALRHYDDALALRRAIGHGDGIADSLVAIGDLLRRTSGDVDRAHDAIEEAVALWRAQGASATVLLGLALLACLPGESIEAAVAALASARPGADSFRVRFLLWQATHDRAHLVEAKRLLDHVVAYAPPECRESMVTNVQLHREIAAAARMHAIPAASRSKRHPEVTDGST